MNCEYYDMYICETRDCCDCVWSLLGEEDPEEDTEEG